MKCTGRENCHSRALSNMTLTANSYLYFLGLLNPKRIEKGSRVFSVVYLKGVPFLMSGILKSYLVNSGISKGRGFDLGAEPTCVNIAEYPAGNW